MLKLGNNALQRVAAKCNVRTILFHETARMNLLWESGADAAVQALKRHGYRVGYIGAKTWNGSDGMANLDVYHPDREPISSASPYENVALELKILPARTMLVKESPIPEYQRSDYGDPILVTLPSHSENGKAQSLVAQFAKELLNYDECLEPTSHCFGPFRIPPTQIFYESNLSFAMVNLKPIVPGHVLVVSNRPVARANMLDVDEVADLWETAHRVGKRVEQHYGASSLTYAIQDGKDAGQTVPHTHIHVIPRVAQDFQRNDDIYTEIEKHERSLFVDNETRRPRSEAEMAAEADQLRPLCEVHDAQEKFAAHAKAHTGCLQ